MPPDTQRHKTTPIVPPREDAAPVIPAREAKTTHHEAAANIARDQIANIYQSHDPVGQSDDTTQAATDQTTENPYNRTHSTAEHAHTEQWKQYHSAWQQYYQQYYERYYVGEVYKTKAELAASVPKVSQQTAAADPEPEKGLDTSEAMQDLRSQIRSRVSTTAKKARASRHFMPIAAALTVMLVFAFLQYNRTIFAAVEAYKSPGNINPANVIVDPSTSVDVGPEPLLVIPKLNVEVPVDYSAKPDHNSQMAAMKNGVAYFGIPGANAKPGQIGNVAIAGHSSNDVFEQGAYKFIFVQLDKLKKGDSIYLNYQGKRYTYSVTRSQVVKPTDVSALTKPTDKPILTLITCTPIGTATNRLLVTATQVSPDPADAKRAGSSNSSGEAPSMPGQGSPTLVERVFGG